MDVVIGTVFVVMIKSDVKVLKVQMNGLSDNLKILNNSFDKLSEVLSRSAVQEQRIGRIEEDMRELRHGKGFVMAEINGEYSREGKR